MNAPDWNRGKSLTRQLSLLGLVATGICSMLGASINVVPFMIQRNVDGIGPYVLPAFLLAAIPAILAAIAYSILSSAMPRAGGSYIYASRGLHPYIGFIASFSQWFGLSIVIGVIAYIIVPFMRDIAIALEWTGLASSLEMGTIRIIIALALIWIFVFINVQGALLYQRTLIPMMIIMFALGAIVIIAGYSFNHGDFANALIESTNNSIITEPDIAFNWTTFFSAASLLISSFIGFDSIAQAGGEAKNPNRNLPLAILLAIGIVGLYYVLFASAVYNAVPWYFIADEAKSMDVSAPGLLGYLLPSGLTVLILTGALIALINDLPAMLLSVSRLMFAWARDKVFPSYVARIHQHHRTPSKALIISGLIASIGVIGSHYAGDFFLGVDIMVTSMMVNFILMCITVMYIDQINPALASDIKVGKSRKLRKLIGALGTILLLVFLVMHIRKDLQNEVEAWYFHSTWVWCIVMLMGTIIFWWKLMSLRTSGINTKAHFQQLPEE